MKEFTYFLKFEDGSNMLSPDVRIADPEWANSFSEKPIAEMYFRVGDVLFGMKGFEKYNFFMEVSESFGGGNASMRIERIFFCGAKAGFVTMHTVDMQSNKIVKDRLIDGFEYGGNATRGWRPGLFGCDPFTGYEDLRK